MPQVSPAVAKERARRLRGRGEKAVRRRLDGEIGCRRAVLVEAGHVGHTEHFMTVKLPPSLRRGSIVSLTMAEHDGRRLTADVGALT
jgi:threonylcarbamoyladenosine tRNA methylthiotransferase MtaB